MPAEDTWVAPVDKLPDVFMGDRDHMYLLPNGDLFILSPDRTRWIKVNGQGGGVTYDDTAVINRLKALEGKTDNFISTVGVSRNGNRVKLTYTLVDGTIKEVEFEDKDTVALAYDDSALKARVKALEDKPVTPTGVNTFFAKGDISGNGTSQNVRVTKDKLVNADTIKVGDTVVDRYWNKDLYNIGMFKVASVNGNDVVLNGVNDLTYRHPKQSLTLADRTLSISEGNSVTLPNDKQTISRQGNKLVLSNGGGEVDLPTPNNATPYDDSFLRGKITALENKPDNDKQTLTFNAGNRNLSISNGNSVTLPNDKQTISKQGNKLILSNGGGEVELPVPNTSVPYDDTALKKRVSDLEARPDNDKQTLTVNNNTLSISGGNSVTLPSQSIHRFYDGDIPGTADTNNTRTVQKTNFRNPDGIKVGDTVEDFWSDQNTINRGIWKVIEVSGNNVKVQGIGNYSTSLWKNLTFNANTRELSLSGGNKVTLPQYVSPEEFTTLKNEYNKLKGAFEKLLQDLKGSGAWKQTGGTIFEGNLYPDRHIATGNINLFGGTVDGNAFIRTNNGKTENDLAGGIN
jgi:hypothetical protein